MAAPHPLFAGILEGWRNTVAPVVVETPDGPVALDRCPDTPTVDLRRGVLDALDDLRRFVGPLDAHVAAQLGAWRRIVWLASDAQVRCCHDTWAAQIVRCVASIRTVGGTC